MAAKKTEEYSRRDFFRRFRGGHRSDFFKVPDQPWRPPEPDAPTRKGPDAVPVALRINQVRHELTVEPRQTLLDVLRGTLQMTGTKLGCDRNACGACTVLLNNNPVHACGLLAVDAEDYDITTIEGLSDGETLHSVQEAFIRHDALQCGFCVPAYILCVKGLLARDPYPTVQRVRDAVSGVLCRCGIHQRVIAAARDTKPVITGLSSIQPEVTDVEESG